MSADAVLVGVLFANRLGKAVRILRVLLVLAFQVVILWLIYKLGIAIYKTVDWKTLVTAHVWLSALVLSVIVLIAGLAVFAWKLSAPVSYGFGEVSFGILSGFTLLLHIGKDYDPTRFMGTVGSIYFISRGFNNIKDGLDKAGVFDLWPFK